VMCGVMQPRLTPLFMYDAFVCDMTFIVYRARRTDHTHTHTHTHAHTHTHTHTHTRGGARARRPCFNVTLLISSNMVLQHTHTHIYTCMHTHTHTHAGRVEV